jgi:hypothetical protein
MFYNGSQKTPFKKDVEQLIDNVIQNFFIEYLKEDLSQYKPSPKSSRGAGSLLGGDEKYGMERFVESL